MKQRLFFLIIACALFGISNAAPKLPTKCSVHYPQILRNNNLRQKDIDNFLKMSDWGQSQKVTSKVGTSYWDVFSDRGKNVTYEEPSASSAKKGELKFNERLRIAEIKNDFAHVYVENNHSAIFPQIKDPDWRGWVPMKNLLLWMRCPGNEFGIVNKALIVVNLDAAQKKVEEIGKVYSNPINKNNHTPIASTMNFYFVMKQESNGMVLLAKDSRLDGGNTDQVLLGWVSPSSYVPWNQRTCLEPNWTPSAVDNLANKEITVYKDKNLSQRASGVTMGKANGLTDKLEYKYRMRPGELRYPLLDNDGNKEKTYKITAFASPNGSQEVPDDVSEAAETQDKALRDKSVVNLIIAIDGTTSMKNYYQPAQEIIKKANAYFSQNGNNVKVGVVIYRDYADGKAVTEHLSMRSPKDAQLQNFLANGGTYGIKTANTTKFTVALYKGLEVALNPQLMGYKKENSNLLIVIGNCGNDEKDTKAPSQKSLIDKCVANNVQVSAFQVENKNQSSFLLFREQMGDIVFANMKAQYKPLGGGKDFKTSWEQLEEGYYDFRPDLPADQQFYIGSLRNAPAGQSMDVNKLYDIIQTSYMKFNNAVAAMKGKIINVDVILENQGASTSNKIDLAFIKTQFSEQQIASFKKSNSLMAFEGYTKKQSDSGDDYWQPIIYISHDEYTQLMTKLGDVAATVNSDHPDRKPYVDAMKALVKAFISDNISEKELNSMSVNEIMAKVEGLNEATQSLKNYTLLQLQSEKYVTNKQFNELVSEFRKKYNALKNKIDNKYPFAVTRNRNKWYWIPVADLP